MKNSKKKIIFYAIIILTLAYAVAYRFGNFKYKELTDIDDFYEQVLELNMDFHKHAYFIMDFDPELIDYFTMQNNAIEEDPYRGSNLYGYTYTYKVKDGKYYVDMEFRYYLNQIKYVLADMRINLICKEIEDLSDYEKVKAIHDYVVRYCEYSYAGNGAYNTLYQGFAVCNGYALTFFRVMEKSGVPVTFEAGGNHAWNKVYLDGYWYNIDLTWDDTGKKSVSYDYFLKCDADWEGHEHGGADAPESMAVVGKTAEEYYKMFPPYQIYTYILIFVVCAGLVVGFAVISYKRAQKKRLKKLARQNEEYEKFLNSRYDDEEWN